MCVRARGVRFLKHVLKHVQDMRTGLGAENTCAENTCAENTCAENTSAENTCAENTCAENTCAENMCAENTCAENTCAENTCAENTCAENTCAENMCAGKRCDETLCLIKPRRPFPHGPPESMVCRLGAQHLTDILFRCCKCFEQRKFMISLMLCAYGWPEPYIYGAYTVLLAGKSPNIRS